jgi:hypothetical protein
MTNPLCQRLRANYRRRTTPLTDEQYVRAAMATLPATLVAALAMAVQLSGGQRPSIDVVCAVCKLTGEYPPEVASFFGYGLPLGKEIWVHKPAGYVDLMQPGAVARGPQNGVTWIGHACFLIDRRARVKAIQVN